MLILTLLFSQSYFSTGTYITISTAVFSPYEESTRIEWKIDNATAPLNVNISLFNIKGVRERVLYSGQLQSGSIVFNGRDSMGIAYPVGVYIVVLDAVDSNNSRFFDRRVLVIGRRLGW